MNSDSKHKAEHNDELTVSEGAARTHSAQPTKQQSSNEGPISMHVITASFGIVITTYMHKHPSIFNALLNKIHGSWTIRSLNK